METAVALELINEQIVYKPGWTLAAEDYSWRMQGGILLHLSFVAPSSDRNDARTGYNRMLEPLHNAFPIIVADCVSEDDLLHKVLKAIIALETHEAREFLRRKPTYDAPFHPHRIADMQRWALYEGTPVSDDLNFGAYAARPGHLTREVGFSRGNLRYTYRVPTTADTDTEADAKAYDPNPMASRVERGVLRAVPPNPAALLPGIEHTD
jgi:hypothetical protein